MTIYGRQPPSGPRIISAVDVIFPEITWSGDVNPPFPPGTLGEGFTTKASKVTVVGVTSRMVVLCALRTGSDEIFTFGIPFSFGYCIIGTPEVPTPFGPGRDVFLGVSLLQNLGAGETISTGPDGTSAKLVFLRLDDTLRIA